VFHLNFKNPNILGAYAKLMEQWNEIATEYNKAHNFLTNEYSSPFIWAMYDEYMNLKGAISILDEDHTTRIIYNNLYKKIKFRADANSVNMDVLHVVINDKRSETKLINPCGYLFSVDSPFQWSKISIKK